MNKYKCKCKEMNTYSLHRHLNYAL